MGLFSSKYETYVGTSASRMIKDALVPNSVLGATIRAILRDESLPNEILRETFAGLGTRSRAAHAYAKRAYIFGSPSQKDVFSAAQITAVRTALRSIEGLTTEPVGTLVMEYVRIGAPNILHIGWFKLMRDHGYNPTTNQLETLATTMARPVYLSDLIVVVPQSLASTYSPQAIEQWGTPARRSLSSDRLGEILLPGLRVAKTFSQVRYDPLATEDYALARYVYTDDLGDLATGEIQLTNSEYDETKDYVHVSYKNAGAQKYWFYQLGLGTYPDVDALLLGQNATPGMYDYFPFIHYRSDMTRISANTSSTEYKHSVRIAKKLGFDYDDIDAAIHENPDIGQVEQAYTAFMVPANSTEQLHLRFLHEFFDRLHGLNVATKTSYSFYDISAAQAEKYVMLIQDTKVKHALSMLGVVKKVVPGVLPGVGIGECTRDFVAAVPASQVAMLTDSNDSTAYIPRKPSSHIYRRQLTSAAYVEIEVLDLEMRYYVEGEHTAAVDEVSTSLLIPIDYAITKFYSLKDQETLYAKSLYIIANSKVVDKVRWYEQEFFQFALLVAAVFMAAYDMGKTFAALLAANAAVIVYLQYILVQILISYATREVFDFIVKELGIDLAVTVAVLLAVAGSADWIKTGTPTIPPSAVELMQSALGLVNAGSRLVMEDLAGLQAEATEFNKEVEAKLKSLETAQELLDSNLRLDPRIIFGESPENFFNRTVHAGNVGTIGYRAVDSYVDMALTLPDVSDTLPNG